ncbi:MAG: hypothetical protein IPM81_07735 [Saprospirales bacterium]|nr:hypothetical protein [Saprospirales bacterium]
MSEKESMKFGNHSLKQDHRETWLCSLLVWASSEMPDVYLGFWCETNAKFLALPFSLKNEPQDDAFIVADGISLLKIASPYTDTDVWQILTLNNPDNEVQFLSFCENILSVIVTEKNEQQRIIALGEVLLKWQPQFD